MKTSLWSRCLKNICYQKITDAKNFILDFTRPRVTLNCGEISFEKECWTSGKLGLNAKFCSEWVLGFVVNCA